MIPYKQWESNDRTTLHTHTLLLADFIDVLVWKQRNWSVMIILHDIRQTFYVIWKAQMDNNTIVVLLDAAPSWLLHCPRSSTRLPWDNTFHSAHIAPIYMVGFNVQCCTKCGVMNWNVQWWKAVCAVMIICPVAEMNNLALIGVND